MLPQQVDYMDSHLLRQFFFVSPIHSLKNKIRSSKNQNPSKP